MLPKQSTQPDLKYSRFGAQLRMKKQSKFAVDKLGNCLSVVQLIVHQVFDFDDHQPNADKLCELFADFEMPYWLLMMKYSSLSLNYYFYYFFVFQYILLNILYSDSL
jgi:hypothetical protein